MRRDADRPRTRVPAADRGGPFGRDPCPDLTRAERAGAAPGAEFRFAVPVESSPLGRAARRARSVVIVLLAGFGLASLGHAGALHAKAALGQWLLGRAWQATRATGVPARPWPWADTHPVARVAVPAQGIDLLVLAGANARTLAWGPGHHDGSAAPGASGLAVITAHRDTHFRFLGDLRIGDRIEVESPAGTRQHFRVVATRVADHRQLLLPEAPGAPMLALVTCWPLDGVDPGTPWRYAVLAMGEE